MMSCGIIKKTVVTGILILGVVFFAVFFLGGITASADSNRRVNERKFYTSYVVETGDSLWEIAGIYMTPEYESRKEYIEEIIASNQLGAGAIYPGQLLILPYYADQPLYS